MRCCVGITNISGIFLVCLIVLVQRSIFKCWTYYARCSYGWFVRYSMPMVLLFFSCCLSSFISCCLLWILFLSDDYCGVRRYNFIFDDFNFFLGYVLLGDKCHMGRYVITNLALLFLFWTKNRILVWSGFSVDNPT